MESGRTPRIQLPVGLRVRICCGTGSVGLSLSVSKKECVYGWKIRHYQLRARWSRRQKRYPDRDRDRCAVAAFLAVALRYDLGWRARRPPEVRRGNQNSSWRGTV